MLIRKGSAALPDPHSAGLKELMLPLDHRAVLTPNRRHSNPSPEAALGIATRPKSLSQ